MSMQEDIKDLVEKITSIDNEIKLLQDDRKTLLEDFKGKIDIKAFKAAMRIIKVRESVDNRDELDTILDVLENA